MGVSLPTQAQRALGKDTPKSKLNPYYIFFLSILSSFTIGSVFCII
ncbi:MAG: hypothetical protein NZ455_10580 [Bacteroidia bacterium]|nr:hypothetical protein [Bacteroidia bacterium]MDW8347940.1 hypothetical protein [Bacteroidia bacterium]